MGKTHKETLGFNSFSGYYASLPAGYGGFDYSNVQHLNATYFENVKTTWCDTGYQNVIQGAGEAFTYQFGIFETANLNETFTLQSMVAASAWETYQNFQFITYTYEKHKGFVLKAKDTIVFSQTAQTVNFAKIGSKGDFTDISGLVIAAGTGSYGNTCSYGKGTTGYQLAFDNLKVKWNGKIPTGHSNHKFIMPPGLANHHHTAAHVDAHMARGGAHAD